MTQRSSEWSTLTAIVGGTIMVVLASTIVNVGLPEIAKDLGIGRGVEWIVTSYLIGVVVAQPVSSWAADRYGRDVVYKAMLGAFSVASLLVALSPNLSALAATRFLQGLAGGGVMPLGIATVMSTFPVNRQGRAMSVWGMAVTAAPALGPTLGGMLVGSIGWRWLFLINVPVGAVALVVCHRLLPPQSGGRARPLDLVGCLLACGGLTLLVLGLLEGRPWGWTSVQTVLCLATASGALAGLVLWERRVRAPLVDLGIFRYRSFRLTSAIVLLVTGAMFSRLLFVPMELETLRGMSAFHVGLLLAPVGAGAGVGVACGGWLTDRIGPRGPIIGGCGCAFLGFVGMSLVDLTTPLWIVCAVLVLQSVGTGTTMSPSIVAGLRGLPPSLATQASAVQALTQQVGGVLGVALLGALLSARMGDAPAANQAQAAFNSVFVAAALLIVVAGVLGARLKWAHVVDEVDEAVDTEARLAIASD